MADNNAQIASTFQGLANTMEKFVRQQERHNEDLLDMFEDDRAPFSNKSEGDVKRREKVRKHELEVASKGVKASGDLFAAFAELRSAMKGNTQDQSRATVQATTALTSLMQEARTLTGKQADQLMTIERNIRTNVDLEKSLKELEKITVEVGEQEKKRYDQQALIVKRNESMVRGFIDMEKAVKNSVKQFFTLSNALVLAGKGIAKQFNQIEYAMKNQVPIMDSVGAGLTNLSDMAARYGVSVETMMELQKKNNQAILASAQAGSNAAGASRQFMEQFLKNRDALRSVTGDMDEAAKLMGASVDMLASAGVRQSFEEMGTEIVDISTIMRKLARATDLTVDQIVEMNKQMMADSEIRFSMLNLNKRERIARVQDLMEYQTLLANKGMETSQIVEATKALQKMTGTMDPKERYKQAARMRAGMGAMGIDGGERIMQLIMKPMTKWSDEERSFYQKTATTMEQSMGNLFGGDQGIGGQMYGGALREMMGGQVLDATLAQSTAGMEGKAIPAATLDAVNEQTTILRGQQDTFNEMKKIWEQIRAWGNDSGIFLAGSSLATLGSIAKTLFEVALYSKILAGAKGTGMLGGIGSKIGGLARGAGGALARGGAAVAAGVSGTAVAGVAGAAAGGYLVGSMANEAFGISDWIVDKLMQSKDTEIVQMMNPAKGTVLDAKQRLEHMSGAGDSDSKKLAEMVLGNTKALQETANLLKQGMDVQKAAQKALDDNTKATETASTTQLHGNELTRKTYRSRGGTYVDNRLPHANR